MTFWLCQGTWTCWQYTSSSTSYDYIISYRNALRRSITICGTSGGKHHDPEISVSLSFRTAERRPMTTCGSWKLWSPTSTACSLSPLISRQDEFHHELLRNVVKYAHVTHVIVWQFLRKMWCGHGDAWENFWMEVYPIDDVFQRQRPWSRSSTTFFTCSCWFGGCGACVAIGWDIWKLLKLNLKLLSFSLHLYFVLCGGWWAEAFKVLQLLGASGGDRSASVQQPCGTGMTVKWERILKVSTRFCHILICPDNFTNASLLSPHSPHMLHFIYFSSRYFILPLAKTTPAWKRPLATSQEAAFSKWSKTRHGRIVVYCKADTEIVETCRVMSPGVWRCAGLSSWHVLFMAPLNDWNFNHSFFVQAQECHAMLETVMRAVESLQECNVLKVF